jgi:hypothetical protein
VRTAIAGGFFPRIGWVCASDGRELANDGGVVSAVVEELAAARGPRCIDAREGSAGMGAQAARLRFDEDEVCGFVRVGCA